MLSYSLTPFPRLVGCLASGLKEMNSTASFNAGGTRSRRELRFEREDSTRMRRGVGVRG